MEKSYKANGIRKPGKYYFSEGMTLEDLLLLAGGVEDKDYIESIYLEQAEIIRLDNSKNFVSGGLVALL